LNEFLKYERDFALPNAFVITDKLRAALIDTVSKRRFPKPRTVPLPNGKVVTCYVDTRHPFTVRESAQSFRAWLRRQVGANKVPVAELLEKSLVRVGDCTVLDSAPREGGYGEVLLEPVVGSPTEDVLEPLDRPPWHQAKLELLEAKVAGISMQVMRFGAELSDDLHPRLQYQTVSYADARAFHLLLERHPETVQRYRERALAVLGDEGTNIPNILSTAIVVIVGTDTPQLVIANRKARTGGYHGGSWAVSIGEQFMPLTGMRGGRHVDADASLTVSIVRGLREELVGDDFTGPMKISAQAFCLEDSSDNFIFVALADLRPLTFRSLTALWHQAGDRVEHNALAAIPAAESAVRLCMNAHALPGELWTTARMTDSLEFAAGVADLPEGAHKWQPNSHIRLACAWWYVAGLQRGV
jgi:hypothetical protein